MHVDRPAALIALWNLRSQQITVENLHQLLRHIEQRCVRRQRYGRLTIDGKRSTLAEAFAPFGNPRMAAEAVSATFLQCTLKGLQRSPRIVTDREAMGRPGVITGEDASCLVIPDGCLGLPTLAALEQGIPVIAVRENRNLMRNDLSALPWSAGQFHLVENYWEAAGVIATMRAGIAPESVRRPLAQTKVEHWSARRPESRPAANADLIKATSPVISDQSPPYASQTAVRAGEG